MNLLHEIGWGDPDSKPPQGQTAIGEFAETHKEKLLKWCRRYGLLGVLPHQAFFIALAPQKKSDHAAAEFWRRIPFVSAGKPAPKQIITQVQFARTGPPPHHWERVEQLVNADAFPPGVLIKSHNSTFGSAPLQYVADFFPWAKSSERDGQLIFDCPCPLSDEFWQIYAEPVSFFLWEAIALRRAIFAMSVKKYREGSDEFFEDYHGAEALSGLLASVRPAPDWRPSRGVKQNWSSASLLGALAMMALSDLPEGEARECELCHKPFVSSGRPQSLYCSTNCRWRAQKRAQRGG